jgi:hypothetical protein
MQTLTSLNAPRTFVVAFECNKLYQEKGPTIVICFKPSIDYAWLYLHLSSFFQMSQEEQQRILYYTNLCETLYGSASHQDRERAEHILEHAFPTFADAAGSGVAARRPSLDSSYAYDISSPQDSAYALTVLLKNSPNPYVQMFASTRLKALITDQFPVFSQEAKIQSSESSIKT